MIIDLFIPGLPAPQGSKTRMPNGAMVDGGSSARGRANLAAWRDALRAECRNYLRERPMQPLAGPVSLGLLFRFPPVASDPYRYWHATTPDASKILRSTEDGLVQGGLLADDRYVARAYVEKLYAGVDQTIGCHVTIYSLAPGEAMQRSRRKEAAKARRKAGIA